MKTIYILRHAKAENGTPDMQDFDRGLTPRGAEDAAALGALLAGEAMDMDKVLCSSAARARQTWEQVSLQWQHTPPAEFIDKLYLATTGDMLHDIQQLDDAHHTVMIVGHNPGLHHLCLTLAAGGDKAALHDLELQFPTCALAMLTIDTDRWQSVEPDSAYLQSFRHHHARADRVA